MFLVFVLGRGTLFILFIGLLLRELNPFTTEDPDLDSDLDSPLHPPSRRFVQDKIREDKPPPNAKSIDVAGNKKRKGCLKLVVTNNMTGKIIGELVASKNMALRISETFQKLFRIMMKL